MTMKGKNSRISDAHEKDNANSDPTISMLCLQSNWLIVDVFIAFFPCFLVYCTFCWWTSITDLWRSYSFSFAFVVIYSMSILIWKITFIIFFVFPCNNSVFIYLRIFFIYFLRLNILFSRLFTLDNSTIISIIHNTNTIFYCLFQYELYLFQYERK